MSRRPLASLRKLHKGKRGISQHEAHLANLRREFREDDRGAGRPTDPNDEQARDTAAGENLPSERSEQ